MAKVTFDDLVYFSLLNFYSTSNFHTSNLTNDLKLKNKDLSILNQLKIFSSMQPVYDRRAYENRAIAGVSFFHDIFAGEDPFLPFGTQQAAQLFEDTAGIFSTVISDRLNGLEGGYVSGGFLGLQMSEMVCPVPFYFVSHKLRMNPETIFRLFLPEDFNEFNVISKIKIANSRTSNTLGAALMGPSGDNKYSEVLVLKESPYGEVGWGKSYRMTMMKGDLSTYKYEEMILLTRREVELILQKKAWGLTISESKSLPYIEREIYLLKRSYKMEGSQREENFRLVLSSLEFVDAKALLLTQKHIQ